jgi:eukaryotic-like serine/threonine-protein kinase
MSPKQPGTLAETKSLEQPRLPAARRKHELVASKYLLERPLAQGGMGSLWVARHVELDVEVAIKFSSMERSDAHDLRFRREARATARLKSPHIVHAFDYGFDGDEPYIAMELLEGESLRELLEREGRLPLERAAALIAEVAKGLQVAHEAGIVHRDLKPSNLFLAGAGRNRVTKILDFGIAKASADATGEAPAGPSNLGTDTTRVGAIVGSPAYMSPEQARGELVDKRSDLWSLAVVTFRALTGSEPFTGAHASETLERICGAEIPRARSVAPELPAELDDFFERGLARPRERRFQSAEELGDALAALAARHPQAERAAGSESASAGRPAETGAVAGAVIGRTSETRPIEVEHRAGAAEPARSRWTSRRVAAVTLAAAAFGTLSLYTWLSRNPASELAPQKAEEVRISAPSPAAEEHNTPGPSRPMGPASSAGETAEPGEPVPPKIATPRRQAVPRASQAVAPPADSSRASRASGAPPPATEDLDPVFGLQR